MIDLVDCADCGLKRDAAVAGPCECGSTTRAIRLEATVTTEVTVDREGRRANGKRFFRKWTRFERRGKRRIERWRTYETPDLYAETVTERGTTRHKCGRHNSAAMHGKLSAKLMRKINGSCPKCSTWAD